MRLTLLAALLLTTAGLPAEESEPVPVIVELFTSQGCSSCPPADRLLAKLHNKQPVKGVEVIVLSEHVDYWNRLGWTDPFSSPKFSARQRWYAERWPRRMYTPQAVVDGRIELIGSSSFELESRILEAARKPKVRLDLDARLAGDGQIEVLVGPTGSTQGDAELVIAFVEDSLARDVTRGENKGRRLAHVGVVRRLETLKKGLEKVTLRRKPEWKTENLRVVAFAQRKSDRAVLAAGTARIQ